MPRWLNSSLLVFVLSVMLARHAVAQEERPPLEVKKPLLGTAPGPARPTLVERVAVRYTSSETGGIAQPQFISERELAFFTRVEAALEQNPVQGWAYPERYVRAATDRIVVRAMLAGLLVQRGSEPPDLPKRAAEAREELAERLGGPAALQNALVKEGLEDAELMAFLRDQVRAAWYIDRAITPILAVTEDALRATYRSALHPFHHLKFEEARPLLRKWLVVERMRSAEIEFLQAARSRIRVTTVAELRAPPGASP